MSLILFEFNSSLVALSSKTDSLKKKKKLFHRRGKEKSTESKGCGALFLFLIFMHMRKSYIFWKSRKLKLNNCKKNRGLHK